MGHHISPVCQDFVSVFQTSKLTIFECCNHFCNLLGFLITYCQFFCKFDHERQRSNDKILTDLLFFFASIFLYTGVIPASFSSLAKLAASAQIGVYL